MLNLTRSAIGGSFWINDGISISIAYLSLSDQDHDKRWFKSKYYFEGSGIQFGLTKSIIEDIIAAQISIGALNIQYDTDAEFEIDYIDKQLGYFVGLSILGNWWGESGFNFVFNTCYDFSDIKNENNELLSNGLSIGFGVQINWNYS